MIGGIFVKVFVYGTLRKHEKNSSLLQDSTCLAEQAWTYGELFTTDLGFPVLKHSEVGKVYGELYEVDEETLHKLDKFEDYEIGRAENFYDRKEVTVYTDIEQATAFVYMDNQARLLKDSIKHGDWKLFHLLQSPPKRILYFAYGSCMDIERIQKANVEHYFQNVVGACRLDGYSMKYLFSAQDGGRADIIEDSGVTEGILYEIPLEGVEYLLHREGFYTGWYRPTFVNVMLNQRLIPNVLTFHVYDKKEEQAPPAHYANEILRGSKGRVSSDYYEKLISDLQRLGCDYIG